MSAVDKIRPLPTIVVANTDPDNVRRTTQAENNKRTERYTLNVTGQVDITVAGAGLRNGGSILAALGDIGYTDGGQDKIVCDARLARFVAEAMAPSALPGVRLGGAGVQAATILTESVPLWLASPRSINPNDTKYVEPNKQLQQQVFITPIRQIGRLVGGAPTGTITNVSATVEQWYDDLLGVPPLLNCFYRQVAQSVTAANAQFKIDLRGSRYIRGIAIQQDSDQGEQVGIITSLVLRGDSKSIIGDSQMPWADLVAASQQEMGGAVTVQGGKAFIDFQRYGRISTFWNPYQDTNLRLELNVAPLGGGVTGDLVRVGIWEYEQTPSTVPADQLRAVLPSL